MEQIGALSVSCRAALDQEGLVLALRDAYYERNDELKVDEARDNLAARVRELSDIRAEIQSAQFLETQALDMGGAAGLGHSAK